jgi:hypothetical protein
MAEVKRVGTGKANRTLDLKGHKSGFLVVEEKMEERNQHGHILWRARCTYKSDGVNECGKMVVHPSSRLTDQRGVKSCGCYQKSEEFKKKRKFGFAPYSRG